MAQRLQAPKFGNWEGDNVPYTVYFENARKVKNGGRRMTPNDPDEGSGHALHGDSIHSHASPAPVRIRRDKLVASENFQHRHYGYQSNASNQQNSTKHMTMASQSGRDRSASGRSLLQPKLHRRRSVSEKNRMHSDDFSYRSVSVPKFGDWDERDPKSGEHFTVIFNRVKKEKQIAAAEFTPLPLQTAKKCPTKTTKSKKTCCLF